MEVHITEELKKEKHSPFHLTMLAHVKKRVDMSARKMSKHYPIWDRNDRVYRAKRERDENDKRALERAEPEKMSIPWTHAQIETFIAFGMGMYLQKRSVFEMRGFNTDGQKAAHAAEQLLDRDFRWNTGSEKMYQFLLDIGRFSLGILKTSWHREEENQWVRENEQARVINEQNVRPATTKMVKKQMTTFLGNKLSSVSPYRFFPDTRLPLGRFQEGEFCASEDTFTRVQLKKMEQAGLVAGVDHIPDFQAARFRNRPSNRFDDIYPEITGRGHPGQKQRADNINNTVVVTECQIDLIPKLFLIDGVPMSDEEFPIRYLIWYANDDRVIRCEPLNYPHGKFTYSIGQFSPDQEAIINESLADLVHYLQDVATWMVNSRISSVRKTINNQVIVDQMAVELKDFADRKTVVRLKKEFSGRPMNTVIQEINNQDVTQSHLKDTQELQKIMQLVTGISENVLGQFSPGRRSAKEAGAVNNQAASRLRLHMKLIFDTGLEPTGRMMLSNLREGLDVPTYVKILGDTPESRQGAEQFLAVTREDLVGDYDFEIFDGTLPTEKNELANTLQELVLGILSNPEAAGILGYDPSALTDEILLLRGVRNPTRFKIQNTQPAPINEPNQPGVDPAGVVNPSGLVQQNGPSFATGGVSALL